MDGKIFSTGGISDGEDSQNNLRSVYVTDGTSLRSTKLKSRMKVGRATHACLATPFKVKIHNERKCAEKKFHFGKTMHS